MREPHYDGVSGLGQEKIFVKPTATWGSCHDPSMRVAYSWIDIRSNLTITDLKNKVSIIVTPPKSKFVRYCRVRLAGGRLEKRLV